MSKLNGIPGIHYPTRCVAHPTVMAEIRRQIEEAQPLTGIDSVIAEAAGLAGPTWSKPLGLNDGLIYPPALEPESMSVRAASARAALPRAFSATGARHALALLVDFEDNEGTTDPAHFEHLLFDSSNPDSLTSFYRDISYGALNVTGAVSDWIRAPEEYSRYTNNASGMGPYPRNSQKLLEDALKIYTQSTSLRGFDQDQDGYIDGVFLIHAGAGAEAEPDAAKRPGMIWSHKWVLPTPFVNDGVRVYAYSTEPEDGRVGVFAHEYGHVLGLPDLYDTTYRSVGVGMWCLMGGGSWGGNGNQPVRMCCWAMSHLGWIQTQNVTGNTRLAIPGIIGDRRACYRIWGQGFQGSEYFLLENRLRSGRDIALPGDELAIWHIDETRPDNTNPRAYRVGLVQADNQRHLERATNSGDADDVYPGGTGNSAFNAGSSPASVAHNGLPSGVAINNISYQNEVAQCDVSI